MNETQPVKERIIKQAAELFLSRGFSRVTTDQLAREIGVSKKTIYRHFRSKEQLLGQAVEHEMERIRAGLQAICEQTDSSSVERLKTMLGLAGVQLARLGPGTLEDISRKAPRIWQAIEEMRGRIFHQQVETAVRAGILEGAIRRDIDPKLTVAILMMIVQHILNPEKLSALSVPAKEVFELVVKIAYQGLLTESARRSFSIGGDPAAAVVGGAEG